MLGEVTDEHVPPSARQSGEFNVFSGERQWKPFVQFTERPKGVEHLSVACRLRAPAGDHVRAVRPVLTDRVSERFGVIQRLVQRSMEIPCLCRGQNVRCPRKLKNDSIPLAFDRLARLPWWCGSRRFSTAEFLDQPRRCGFLYPRLSWTPADSTTSCAMIRVPYVITLGGLGSAESTGFLGSIDKQYA